MQGSNVNHAPAPFVHEYVRVNDGRWRSMSDYEMAIARAKDQALVAGRSLWELQRIVIDVLPCPDQHIDACAHLRVTLYEKED